MGGSTPQTQTQQSNTSQNQNSTNTTGANPYILPQLQQGVGDLSSYYNANPTAPSYYPGSTYAGQSGMTQDAINALYQYGASGGSPLTPQATQTMQGILNPNYLNVGNDPNFQASLLAGFQPQNMNFNDTTLPNLRSQFEGSGRNLGGADMSTAQLAQQNLEQTQSNSAAQATQAQYAQNQNNQLGVLNMLPAYQNMTYQNLGAMGAAGQQQDQNSQNYLNSNVAAYNYGTTAQPNYISDFLSRIQAGYPGGQTTGQGSSTGNSFSQGTATPASNSTSSFLGGGLGIAGLGLQAASLFPGLIPSDERLKEDIKPVGKLDDGQNIYSYRYKGSPTTQIGLMAQEVAQIHPEAVAQHPSGYLMVDYDKAIPSGGLF